MIFYKTEHEILKKHREGYYFISLSKQKEPMKFISFPGNYFTANKEGEKGAIYYSKLKDDAWTPIRRADFTRGKNSVEMHPFVSPNGERIYFTALDSIFKDENICFINRLENSWSNAVALDSPINEDLVFFPNQAKI
jgi:hypothetical protein